MMKTFWKCIVSAIIITIVACTLFPDALTPKHTCAKSGCTREASTDSIYCWVHKPSKSSTASSSVKKSSSSQSSKSTNISASRVAATERPIRTLHIAGFTAHPNQAVRAVIPTKAVLLIVPSPRTAVLIPLARSLKATVLTMMVMIPFTMMTIMMRTATTAILITPPV